MTSLTLAQAGNLSQDELLAGVIQEFITTDNFAAMLPFVPANGKALVYTRELTDPKTTVGNLDIAGTVVSSAPTVTQITQPIGRIAGDAEVDNFIETTMSGVQNIADSQVTSKVRGVARKWSENMITGTGTFPQPSGINTLVDSSNMWVAASSTTAGASLTFALMDQLMDLVVVDANEFVFLTNRTIRRKLKALFRALGGAAIETVEIGWINPVTTEEYSKLVMAYEGYPVLLNDNIAAESTYGKTGKHRLSFIGMGEDVGLTGIMPADADPGFRIDDVGFSETKDASIMRVKMYTGVALYSTKALGQLVNMLGT
jgi:hypothetical protein